jgi:hypothetical protein
MKTIILLFCVTISLNLFSQDLTIFDIPKFNELTKKGNMVFIECDVPNSIIHATKYLKKWDYWTITDKKENANFILKLVLVLTWPDYFGQAKFIDPKTNKIMNETKIVNTIMSTNINTKKGVIEKVIRKGVKPLFLKK